MVSRFDEIHQIGLLSVADASGTDERYSRMGLSVTCQATYMSEPSGFGWEQRKNGDVVITHHGRVATILRNRKALDFVDAVGHGDDQELMARLTGNYRRGNERHARSHERNR